MTGTIHLDPIHITHPEDVRAGAHRTAESQFVYDAGNPGNLRLERQVALGDPRPTVRGYVMHAPDDDQVLTDFLEENVMWTTPRLEECGSGAGEVDITWEPCDVWDENLNSSQPTCNPNYQPTQNHEHFGMGLQAEVIYEGLPSCNAGFGRKLAWARVRDPEFNSSRNPIAGAFRGAGQVNVEVFYDVFGDNHPLPPPVTSVDLIEKAPNWFVYYRDAVGHSDMRWIETLDAGSGSSYPVALVPAMRLWEEYGDFIGQIHMSNETFKSGNPRGGTRSGCASGMDWFANAGAHEDYHVEQILSYNVAIGNSPARSDANGHHLWSFIVPRGSVPRGDGDLWNHYITIGEEPDLVVEILDVNESDIPDAHNDESIFGCIELAAESKETIEEDTFLGLDWGRPGKQFGAEDHLFRCP